MEAKEPKEAKQAKEAKQPKQAKEAKHATEAKGRYTAAVPQEKFQKARRRSEKTQSKERMLKPARRTSAIRIREERKKGCCNDPHTHVHTT